MRKANILKEKVYIKFYANLEWLIWQKNSHNISSLNFHSFFLSTFFVGSSPLLFTTPCLFKYIYLHINIFYLSNIFTKSYIPFQFSLFLLFLSSLISFPYSHFSRLPNHNIFYFILTFSLFFVALSSFAFLSQ